MTFLADPSSTTATPPRFAFAIPRKVGNAVERNRLRRVVRARLVERLDRLDAQVAPGAYLVAVRPSGGVEEPAMVAASVERCLDELWARR